MINRLLLASAFLAASAALGAAATVSVNNVGSILNQSEALPPQSTPGLGTPFAQFFEFSLPTTETVTVSMSDSGVGRLAVVDGTLSLNNLVSTGSAPLFIPSGTLIESSPIVNVVGGQEATVTPDALAAGSYFAEVTGTSGSSPIRLAIDGTVTATQAVPEPSTWAMMLIGAAFMAWGGWTRRKARELAV
jgi:hypothetical protein